MDADREAVDRFYSSLASLGHSQSFFFKSPSATLLNKTGPEEKELPDVKHKPQSGPKHDEEAGKQKAREPVNVVQLYRKWKTMSPIYVEAKVTYAHDALPCKYKRLSNARV